MGTGPLEHVRQLWGLLVQCPVRCLTQRGERPTGLTQRRAPTLGPLPKRLACLDRPRSRDALHRARGNELGLQGVGHRRWHAEWSDLPSHRPRDERDRGLHVGHAALSFPHPVQAGLAEPCVLRNGTHPRTRRLQIRSSEWAVATHAARDIDTVGGLAAGAAGAPCSRLVGALRERPGPGWSGALSAPCSCPWTGSRRSCAAVAVWAAARCLVARGPETALTSACCTWKKSGEWCAPR